MPCTDQLNRNEKILAAISVCCTCFWLAQIVSNGNISSFSTWSLYILCIVIGTYIILPGLYIGKEKKNYTIDASKIDVKMANETDGKNIGEKITAGKNIFKYFLALFYTIFIIFTIQIISSVICICTINNLYVVDYILTLFLCGSFAAFLFVLFIVKYKIITKENFYGQQSNNDDDDDLFIIRSKTNKPFKNHCCQCCCISYCYYFGLPIMIYFCFSTMIDTISLNDTYINPELDSSLGIVAGKTIGHKLYFQCTLKGKYNSSQPTVLFMHGWSGSAFDATHVARDPKFVATGAKFCSMSRAGYGFSDTISHDTEKSNFGYLAKMTQEGLHEIGVTGDLILMFHSYGGIQALALANQLSNDETINVAGAVAIDASTVANSVERGADRYCSDTTIETPSLTGLLLPSILKALPRGSYRVAVNIINFMDIGTMFKWFPEDIQPRYKSNWFKLKKEDVVYIELKDIYRNCGWALKGQLEFMKMKRIETFIRYVESTPDSKQRRIFTDFIDVANNNQYYNVTNNHTTVIVGDKSTGLTGMHAKMLFQKKYAEKFITPGLLRVINDL